MAFSHSSPLYDRPYPSLYPKMNATEYGCATAEPIFLHSCPHGCYPQPITSNGPGIFKRALNSFFSFVKKVSSAIGKFLVKERATVIATASAVVFGCLMWNMHKQYKLHNKQYSDIKLKLIDVEITLHKSIRNLKLLWNYTSSTIEKKPAAFPYWSSTSTPYDTW